MIFLDNKYSKIYYSMIERRKLKVLDKTKEYCERHHILPKSLGGTDEEKNLINLTAREHYIAHKLLTKMTSGKSKVKMFWAFHRIIHSKNSDFKINAKNYEYFRLQWSNFMKYNHPSKTTDYWCDVVSKSIKLSWENDFDRKKRTSESMKQKWLTGKVTKEQSRINGRHGMKGKEIHNTLDIEYKGVVYYGWSELKNATGVSKFLYKKYYINNIDPETRVGKNGPNPKSSTTTHLKKEVSV